MRTICNNKSTGVDDANSITCARRDAEQKRPRARTRGRLQYIMKRLRSDNLVRVGSRHKGARRRVILILQRCIMYVRPHCWRE